MWVVKLGGSLSRDEQLRGWLDEITALGGGRVVLVAGGATFADEVRDHQQHWKFDDVAAHNMAVLAMVQYALMLRALCPQLMPARDDAQILEALRAGRVALWLPFEVMREQPDELTRWSVTSDSLAVWLSNRLNAERLIVVKACALADDASVEGCVAAGILDASFSDFVRGAAYPVQLLSRAQLPRLRDLLLAPESSGAL
jgi:aspartokinase-like uncharacterized kinase